MGLYGDKKDYEELVKENMYKAKILSNFPKEYYEEVNILLNQREIIKNQNNFFTPFKLKAIDKKINKLKVKSLKN